MPGVVAVVHLIKLVAQVVQAAALLGLFITTLEYRQQPIPEVAAAGAKETAQPLADQVDPASSS